MKRKDFVEEMRTVELLMSDFRKASLTDIEEKWPSRLEAMASIMIRLANKILDSHED